MGAAESRPAAEFRAEAFNSAAERPIEVLMEAARADLQDGDSQVSLVLVADDDEDIRSLVALRLRRAGYEVVTAANGEEALALAHEHEPDLLLLDVSMPRLDGYAVCRQVQALGPTAPPVIFLTARTHAAGLLEGFDAGASDYVMKPFRPDELLARVQAVLRTKALRDAYADDATTDALTGLLNRRGLETRAAEAIAIARRHGRPLGCLIVDLDHFKAINDTYGHAAGDRCLQETAHRLRSNLRASDIVARYGGEEFLLLLPEADHAGALAVAEKIRGVVAETPVEVETERGSTAIRLQASVGLASWEESMTDLATLYAAADRALYEAKRAGRNRVAAASDLP
jgi:diguanylate cyclase (GGDEF)-like protein